MSQSPDFASDEPRRPERGPHHFRAASPPGVFWHEGEWYVRASSLSSGQPKLSLKDNDAFLVANAHGDFPSTMGSEYGYYHRGTRYLSTLEVRLRGELPLLLDSHGEGSRLVVELTNGVSLDYMDVDQVRGAEHYAFLVSEPEFDEIFGRIQERDLPYWADPFHSQPGRINHGDGGRGVYWSDPDGHSLEIITRPYGSGPP